MVYGSAASGKSNVIYLMKKFFREQGFNVTLKPDNDHPNEEAFDKAIGKHHAQAVEGMKPELVINIEEKTIKAPVK